MVVVWMALPILRSTAVAGAAIRESIVTVQLTKVIWRGWMMGWDRERDRESEGEVIEDACRRRNHWKMVKHRFPLGWNCAARQKWSEKSKMKLLNSLVIVLHCLALKSDPHCIHKEPLNIISRYCTYTSLRYSWNQTFFLRISVTSFAAPKEIGSH